ncbi:hypothetical protein SLEP1_g31568 [Rubroshorea leprosula]|uniref:Uncharacterized protein n=1 Tax=Rubroshorea leprosula TaxID=152421 RepID=A0AAV5K3P8_9ROSI|nr:hypothetical protein SLEP1_g31568 [Rubroshorea leprosula]
MLNHQPGVPRNPLSSINPDFQISTGTGDHDFGFWDSRQAWYNNKFSNLDGNEMKFQVEVDTIEGPGSCSPPLWKKNEMRDARHESSPLLPYNHQYSNLGTQSHIIAEGRKKLMEMIENMPESSYELSLKDIVDEQHVAGGNEEIIMVEERSFRAESENEIEKQKKKRKKKSIKSNHISRSGSMDTDAFLIKLFFPTSLGLNLKKRAKAGNESNISTPLPESEESDSHAEKQWWIKKIFKGGNGKNRGKYTSRSGRSCSSASCSSTNSSSSQSRHDNTNSFPSCWLFFQSKKSKMEE